MRGDGVFEGIFPIDQDVQCAVVDPVHHLRRALAPLMCRLLRSVTADEDKTDTVRLLPQPDCRNVAPPRSRM